jgi:hypothetical protein
MSALPPKADITENRRDVRLVAALLNVRFTPENGHH